MSARRIPSVAGWLGLAALVLLAGCERPPMETTQQGFRGTADHRPGHGQPEHRLHHGQRHAGARGGNRPLRRRAVLYDCVRDRPERGSLHAGAAVRRRADLLVAFAGELIG